MKNAVHQQHKVHIPLHNRIRIQTTYYLYKVTDQKMTILMLLMQQEKNSSQNQYN